MNSAFRCFVMSLSLVSHLFHSTEQGGGFSQRAKYVLAGKMCMGFSTSRPLELLCDFLDCRFVDSTYFLLLRGYNSCLPYGMYHHVSGFVAVVVPTCVGRIVLINFVSFGCLFLIGLCFCALAAWLMA